MILGWQSLRRRTFLRLLSFRSHRVIRLVWEFLLASWTSLSLWRTCRSRLIRGLVGFERLCRLNSNQATLLFNRYSPHRLIPTPGMMTFRNKLFRQGNNFGLTLCRLTSFTELLFSSPSDKTFVNCSRTFQNNVGKPKYCRDVPCPDQSPVACRVSVVDGQRPYLGADCDRAFDGDLLHRRE